MDLIFIIVLLLLGFASSCPNEPCWRNVGVQCNKSTPMIQLHPNETFYTVKNISCGEKTLIIQDQFLSKQSGCNFAYEFSNPIPHFNRTLVVELLRSCWTLFNCEPKDYDFSKDVFDKLYKSSPCNNYSLHYWQKSDNCLAPRSPSFEWKLYFGEDVDGLSLLSAGFTQPLDLGSDCCQKIEYCSSKKKSNGQNILVGVTAGVAGAGLIVACFVCLLFYRRKRRRDRSSSSKPLVQTLSSMRDTELGSGGTHIFSYDELREATNCFDASLELGDGGFGTVYKGKLRDGRVVAVKRLYENNYKRAEQFINEVDILSRLRHQNLVTLYGCTSRRSRELLLVYEFVSNGTVADHLHGSRSSEGALAWAHRMRIAVETADALAYLHAVEPQIIHRDVKTTNILLDDGFHVKVGDFGLSRLFPLDATHVSTLPQGTPGYVDPEYHQCYQLTDKSDVYSFGVVLVELISSKPAVDISRSRNEINLSSMAINRIRNRELDQLVDPELGFQYDEEKKRMITRVADLAFRCLQAEKEMRPSIKEVLEELQRIVSGGCEEGKDPGVEEESVLLKSVQPFSPDSVTVRWDSSRSTTSNTSTG